MSKRSERIKGLTIALGGDASGLIGEFNKVNKEAQALGGQIKDVERGLKLDPGNVILLTEKSRLLTEQIAKVSDRLKLLRDNQERVTEQFKKGEISQETYSAFIKELGYAEGQYKRLNIQLSNNATAMDSVEKRMASATEATTAFGDVLKANLLSNIIISGIKTMASAMKDLGKTVINAGIEFESAFAGVEKTVDGSTEQIAALKTGIRSMAKEIPATTTEIAGVAEAAGQLGIQTDNILDFTEVMIGMGEATDIAAKEAATSLAQFANITQMSQGDFSRLGSAIVALGNNFATSESKIVDMSMRLAGAGYQIGMSHAEIMSFAAAISSLGIEAEAGGSAVSKAMVQMQLAVETGSNELESFASVAGMSAEEFKRAFQEDAAGAFNAFIQGLGNAQEQGKSTIAVLDEMGISEVRMRDALLRLSGAGDTLADAITLGNEAWAENAALQNEVEQRYATTESQLQIMKNGLMDAALTISEGLLPGIKRLAEAFTGFLDDNQEAIEEFGESLSNTLTFILDNADTIAALLTGIGAAFITWNVGSMVVSLAGAITALGGAATVTSIGVATLGTAINAALGPVGLASMAIGVLVTAITALAKEADKAKVSQEELNNKINEYIDIRDAEVSADNIGSKEARIKEIEELKDTYSQFLDIYNSKQGEEGLSHMVAMEAAAQELGISFEELWAELKVFGIEVTEVDEATLGLKDNTALLDKEIEALTQQTSQYEKKTVEVAQGLKEQAARTIDVSGKMGEMASELKGLEKAYETVAKGEELSTEQLVKLTQLYPEISELISDNGEAALGNGEIFKSVAKSKIQLIQEELEAEKIRLEALLDSSRQAVEAAKEEYRIKSKAAAEYYNAMSKYQLTEASEKVKQETEEYEKLAQNLDKVAASISLLGSISSKTDTWTAQGTNAAKATNAAKEKNEVLERELSILEHRIKMDEYSTEQELAHVQQILQSVKMSTDERESLLEREHSLTKKLRNEETEAEEAALKAYGDALTEALKRKYQAEYDAKKEVIDAQLELTKKAQYDEESLIKEFSYKVKDAYGNEVEYFESASNEKIQILNDEYIEKIRLIDEATAVALEGINKEIEEELFKLGITNSERAEQIQALRDKITGINEASEADKRAIEEKRQAERTANLQKKIEEAQTIEELEDAQVAMTEHLEDIARKAKDETRKAEIKGLQDEIKALEQKSKDEIRIAKENIEEKKKLQEESLNELGVAIETGEFSDGRILEENLKNAKDIYDKMVDYAPKVAAEIVRQGEAGQKAALEIMEKFYPEWTDAGKNFVDFYKEGIEDATPEARKAMESVGKQAIEGLKRGLENNEHIVLAKAKAIADAVAEVMRTALDEHSPSKVTEKIGENAGYGLANGIENTINAVRLASAEIANAAALSIGSGAASAAHSVGLESGADIKIYQQFYTPTTTPSTISRANDDLLIQLGRR